VNIVINKKIVAGFTAIGLAIALTAGSCEGNDKQSAQSSGQAQTEQAFNQQQSKVPYPVDQLKDSQERRNLKERLLRQNNPNHVSYLYVLSFAKPLGYYVIKGKVSSTQSQMTTDNLVIDRCSGSTCPVVVNAPGDDGSYGANEPGIFFFTANGVMVQTDLNYVVSDQPIPFGELNVPKLG
jgi:hypothetical protein